MLGIGRDHRPVGEHDVRRVQVVQGQPEPAAEGPYPPPRVRPARPTDPAVPVTGARPYGAAAAATSAAVAPACTSATRAAG
nr:hypothetical protein GCM10025730_51720 [Promicromonospora thailandica]